MKSNVKAADFRYFVLLQTRFLDSDFNHHLNNSVYTSFWNTMLQTYLLRCCPGAKEYGGVFVSASNDFLKPAAFPNKLLGAMKITDTQDSIITLQYGIFNPKNSPREPQPQQNNSKGIPSNGFIPHNSRDIGNLMSGFEASPCMIGTSKYMFLTRAGDNEKTISFELQNQLQDIHDIDAKL